MAMPWLAPPGETVLTVDFGAAVGDDDLGGVGGRPGRARRGRPARADPRPAPPAPRRLLDPHADRVPGVRARHRGGATRGARARHRRARERGPQRGVRPPADGGRLLAHAAHDPRARAGGDRASARRRVAVQTLVLEEVRIGLQRPGPVRALQRRGRRRPSCTWRRPACRCRCRRTRSCGRPRAARCGRRTASARHARTWSA